MRLYKDLNVILKIGKEKAVIPYGCGVRQGDTLAPTLFIMVIQLATELAITRMKEAGINIVEVEHNGNRKGTIRKHKRRDACDHTTEINSFLYIDDGAFIFNSREETTIGTNIIFGTFFGIWLTSTCWGKKR